MNITETVFPVYAGVILSWSATLTVRRGVPRVCGGDPNYTSCNYPLSQCSPCMRG